MTMKLDASQLRDYKPSPEELSKIKRKPIYIVCDNILDTYNIGAIFRLADAAAVSGVYLVGGTSAPTDPLTGHKVHKASVGTWQWTPWKHVETITEAVEEIRNNVAAGPWPAEINVEKGWGGQGRAATKLQVIAVEQSEKRVPYTKAE